MADVEESIFLRDPSLEEQVRALVKDVPTHPDRILVESFYDPEDPDYRLSITVYPTSEQQRDDQIALIRNLLKDELDITDAPTGDDLSVLELERAELRRA